MAPLRRHPLRLFRVFPLNRFSDGGGILDVIPTSARLMHARTMCMRTKRFGVEILVIWIDELMEGLSIQSDSEQSARQNR